MSNLCSTTTVDRNWQEQSRLPSHCRQGHPWGPDQVTVGWAPCDCPVALADSGRGHLIVRCRHAGCTETWHIDVEALIGALQRRSPSGDRDSPPAMAAPGAASALLAQAYDHQLTLLKPAHPSAARIAGLRSWIQDCVSAFDQAQRLEALIGDDELTPVKEIAAKMAAVLDSFHIYTSVLKRSRSAQIAMGPLPKLEPLAAVADNERALLNCRSDLRESMQHLIAALQAAR